MKKSIVCALAICLLGLAACADKNVTHLDVSGVTCMETGKWIYLAFPTLSSEPNEAPEKIVHDLSNYLLPYGRILLGKEDFSLQGNLQLAAFDHCVYMGAVHVNTWQKSEDWLTTSYDISLDVTFYDVASGASLGTTAIRDTCSARDMKATGYACIEPTLRKWAHSLFLSTGCGTGQPAETMATQPAGNVDYVDSPDKLYFHTN